MTELRAALMLRWSAALTVVGLAFMLWSLAVPTALPVVLAMSVGQGLGTLAFALYGWVVVSELRVGRAVAKGAAVAGPEAATEQMAATEPEGPEGPRGPEVQEEQSAPAAPGGSRGEPS